MPCPGDDKEMVEVSETATKFNPALGLVDGEEPTMGPSAVGEEAQADASATPANVINHSRRTPAPNEPLLYIWVWRIGEGERRRDFIGKPLDVIDGVALEMHLFDFKWSDRNNQREAVLKPPQAWR